MNKVVYLLIISILFSGCADNGNVNNQLINTNLQKTNDIDNNTVIDVPAIMIRENEQAHLITILGSTSDMLWSNITATFIEPSDLSCHHDTPIQGHIKPGHVIHITADLNTQCYLNIDYNGINVGSWTLDFTEN